MTEKQKMLKGELYNSRDPKILQLYHKARRLTTAYNALDSENSDKRQRILQELLGFVGEKVWIEAPFFCDYGENIEIGESTFDNTHCIFLDCNKISIGKNGLIAPHVQIYTADHPLKAEDRILGPESVTPYRTSARPVTIGDNVWIGGNTVICPGVSIGNNVTIGAGSVVTKDLPDNVVAYGNPCKIQKEL